MPSFAPTRATPVVGRLIIANAVVLLLMTTVFTSPAVERALAFSPPEAVQRPWSALTYMFVHGGLIHLALNMLGLWMFGSPVERRMGSRSFLGFYLLCGVGAALFALGLMGLQWRVHSFVGASGAVLGVSVAFAMLWPEAELIVFPIPVPLKARTVTVLLVAFNALMIVLGGDDGVAYEAHVGGAAAGYLMLRLKLFGAPDAPEPPRPLERMAMAPSGRSGAAQPGQATAPRRAPRRAADADPVAVELDRVLDKISATGIDSLTPDERRFLDDQSRRKRNDA